MARSAAAASVSARGALSSLSIGGGVSPQAASNGWFNVRDFGAKGDGVTDDTLAIQNAMAAAPAGSTVLLTGTHIISGLIRFNVSGVRLTGDNRAVLQAAAGSSARIQIGSGTNFLSDCILDGFYFDQTGVAAGIFGISAFVSERLLIDRVRLEGATDVAISIDGDGASVTRPVVRNCWISDCDGDGIITSTDATDALIEGCYVNNCRQSGAGALIYMRGPRAKVRHTFCTTSADNGIRVEGHSSIIFDCEVTDIVGDALRLTGDRSRAVACYVHDRQGGGGSGHGIRITAALGAPSGLAGLDCGIYDCVAINCANGVRIDETNGAILRAIVQGCHLTGNQTDGINISGSHFAILKNNVLRNNVRDGIRGGDCMDVIASGNMCYDDQGVKTQDYGIQTTGTSNRWIVTGNNARAGNHATGAILLVGAGNVNADNIIA